ncbi:hypothetical protein C3432_01800 [Citrobacter amalonaticus]|uniref:NAD(+)--protein-arginine ADP-ribosyltransferase n=1 Tax=Citrobacter amalonaticus TaxID=35703 RepID=A0A2S4S2I6_CITAM|nr:hypothetical protein C3432_01800 [Citrobacter amalonaticus]POT77610.1 hypothetical protein C3436_09470 [Citrobacter amalonaticus]POU68062.1 hypothetical protein C3430_03005 [Citrobacter amalonaticus]POV07666.1 hypothetical protein C3424_03015 [Citrobacter amalonaticus]
MSEAIKTDTSLLKNLQSVSVEHGKDASVRLKDGKFKYGQASNFLKNILHGSRYQTEREDAATKLNIRKNDVSVSAATSILKEKVKNENEELQVLKQSLRLDETKLTHLQDKKYEIGDKLENIAKNEFNAVKAKEKAKSTIEVFSAIYQNKEGCKALISESRVQSGYQTTASDLNGKKIISECKKIHGDDIFSRGNNALKFSILTGASDIPELVKKAEKAFYTPTDKNIVTYRGQGMTEKGISTLIQQFDMNKENNKESIYKSGQFFSTSRDHNLAREYADNSQDKVKVMFKVKGNSSTALSVPGGLSFHSNKNESLYSPLAHFKVTGIATTSGIYNITLEEVAGMNNAPLLPY